MSNAEQRATLAASALLGGRMAKDGHYAPGKNREISEQAVAIAQALEEAAAH
jgi:hypothetical protein